VQEARRCQHRCCAGDMSEVQAEIKRPKKQIAELEKANEILRSASVFFATEPGYTSSR